MKIIVSFFLLMCLLANKSFAQSPLQYISITIPDTLLKDAGVVTRFKSQLFDIDATDEATFKVHSIQTVLSDKGKRALFFAQKSDKFHKLEDAEITVYNALGKKLNNYKKKEMNSQAYGDGLVEDGTYTWFSVTAPSYPITVETEYTIKFKGVLEFPDFYIQTPYESVEESGYTITYPPELSPRILANNTSIKPAVTTEGKKNKTTFLVKNLTARHYEDESGAIERNFPYVSISPSKFKIGGYEGDMSTWKNFGLWSYNLIGQTNQLSDELKVEIQQLTSSANTINEKARRLYAYLQKNMRYVSIQLGIGGWKPFPADFVYKKKYGDCKALTNFMQAALSAAGVKSYYALINNETNGLSVNPNFPASEFNHVILCVPDGKDSIWLECTSSIKEFGRIGYSNENRKALLITENGGQLANTPKSKALDNEQVIASHVYLNEEGSAKTSSKVSTTGYFRDIAISYLHQKTDDDKRAFVVKGLEWKQPDELMIKHGEKENHLFDVAIEAYYEKLIMTKAGSKMFIPSALYNFFDESIPIEKRKYDFFFSGPYIKRDTTIFHLPKNYVPDQLPENKAINTDFGKYSLTAGYNSGDNTVQVVRMLEIPAACVKADTYTALCEFKMNVDGSVKSRLVIKQQ